jgi:hypothetical protein
VVNLKIKASFFVIFINLGFNFNLSSVNLLYFEYLDLIQLATDNFN